MRARFESVKEDYLRDGGCCLRQCVDPSWLETLKRGLVECEQHPSHLSKTWHAETGGGRFFQDAFVWRSVEALERFLFDSGLASVVAEIMGSRALRVYGDHVFVRNRGTSKETPWHQDAPYTFVDGEQFCTVWLPLDGVPRERCLRLVAGSHRGKTLYAPMQFGTQQLYECGDYSTVERVPDIDAHPEEYRILSWDLEPGDGIIFHSRMIHGLPAILLANDLRTYATRWIGDDARFAQRPWETPKLPFDVGLAPGDRFDGPLFPRVI